MKQIPLSQGLSAIVDDEDYESLIKNKWFASRSRGGNAYAMRIVRVNNKRRQILMHREILGLPRVATNLYGDHVNRDPLDNRRCNLRIATKSQNTVNTGLRTDNKSGYKGVYKVTGNRWRAMIRYNNNRISLGTFSKLEDAVARYNEKAKELFGAFARLDKDE